MASGEVALDPDLVGQVISDPVATAQAIDQFRRGQQLDSYGADQALFQYSRAAKELGKFCNLWRS